MICMELALSTSGHATCQSSSQLAIMQYAMPQGKEVISGVSNAQGTVLRAAACKHFMGMHAGMKPPVMFAHHLLRPEA